MQLTVAAVLNNHERLVADKRRTFAGTTLAYVTPVSAYAELIASMMAMVAQWNSRGYDIAKWQAKKFDLLCPVWFQLTPAVDDNEGCRIEGVHDLDRGAATSVA